MEDEERNGGNPTEEKTVYEEHIPTNEERYAPSIKRANDGDCDSAGYLLWAAASHIEDGRPIPEPLARYIGTVLHSTINAATAFPEESSKKRATKIVHALNLQRSPVKRPKPSQKAKREKAIIYMYERANVDNITVNAAATEALDKFPDTGCKTVEAFVKMFNASHKKGEAEFAYIAHEMTKRMHWVITRPCENC